MNKRDFTQLFAQALETATQHAEKKLGYRLPRSYQIRLYGAGCSGNLLEVSCALEKLYLNEKQFYRVIDLSVTRVNPQNVTVFVRVSGHRPVPFAQTWNTQLGNGPFKQLISQQIEVEWPNRRTTQQVKKRPLALVA